MVLEQLDTHRPQEKKGENEPLPKPHILYKNLLRMDYDLNTKCTHKEGERQEGNGYGCKRTT